jgi:hypothetical protein
MPASSRLKVGVDVPWVTSWSRETIGPPAPCPSVDGDLAIQQLERPGAGRPLYSKNHLFRQRRSVRELLCPMCGEPTQDGDRWTQTGQWTTAGHYRAHGLGGWLPRDMKDDQVLLGLGAVAPLHRACAERSLVQCPHLKGMADKELKPFPAAWIVAPMSIAPRAGAVGARPAITFLWLIGVPDTAKAA